MLANGSRLAPTVCLRCQIQILLQGRSTRPIPLSRWSRLRPTNSHYSRRDFSSTRRKDQEFDDEQQSLPLSQPQKSYKWKRIHTQGRIIGKPGKRQRETSAKLKTSSLGKPLDVVLLQDVIEVEKRNTRNASRDVYEEGVADNVISQLPPSTSNIKIETNDGIEPDQQEVEASINTIRPTDTLLDKTSYNQLIRALVHSYNAAQLSQYLRTRLSAVDEKPEKSQIIVESRVKGKSYQKSIEGLKKSTWRPGKTSIFQRHGSKVVKTVSTDVHNKSAKYKLADRILRQVWNVLIDEQQQQIGELEMHLRPWQLSFLFDLMRNGKEMYQTLLASPFLVKSAKVEPFRPHNIVRITARQHVAEEVAKQLEQKLFSHAKLNINLKPLLSPAGGDESGSNAARLFREEDLKEISSLTQAVFDFKSETSIVIRAMRMSNALSARRNLLALLDTKSLTEITSSTVADAATEGYDQMTQLLDDILIPIVPGPELHRRHYRTNWYRQSAPRQSLSDAPRAASSVDELNSTELFSIENISEPAMKYDAFVGHLQANEQNSYWSGADFNTYSQQRVIVGRHLVSLDQSRVSVGPQPFDKDKQSQRTLFLPHCSAHTVLLSHLDPMIDGIEGVGANATTHLELQYMPNVFAPDGLQQMRALPRIKLIYERPHGKDGRSFFQLAHIEAIWHQHNVNIPVPNQTYDLQLVRQSHLYPDMAKFMEDEQISDLTRSLNESLREGRETILNPRPSITFSMPAWLKSIGHLGKSAVDDRVSPQGADAWKSTASSYMLERFELKSHHSFVPPPLIEDDGVSSGGLRHLSNVMRNEGQAVTVTEVNAGALAGRRHELSVSSVAAPSREQDETQSKQCASLIKTGLLVLDAITQATNGKLKFRIPPVERHTGQVHEWSSSAGMKGEQTSTSSDAGHDVEERSF